MNILGRRILAFLIDELLVMLFMMLLSLVPLNMNTDTLGAVWLDLLYYFALLSCMFILIFKDIIGGQSIGKRIMKIKVVDLYDNKPNIFRLILRNITIFIWPVEFLLLLLGKRKIGDILAKTEIIAC